MSEKRLRSLCCTPGQKQENTHWAHNSWRTVLAVCATVFLFGWTVYFAMYIYICVHTRHTIFGGLCWLFVPLAFCSAGIINLIKLFINSLLWYIYIYPLCTVMLFSKFHSWFNFSSSSFSSSHPEVVLCGWQEVKKINLALFFSDWRNSEQILQDVTGPEGWWVQGTVCSLLSRMWGLVPKIGLYVRFMLQ